MLCRHERWQRIALRVGRHDHALPTRAVAAHSAPGGTPRPCSADTGGGSAQRSGRDATTMLGRHGRWQRTALRAGRHDHALPTRAVAGHTVGGAAPVGAWTGAVVTAASADAVTIEVRHRIPTVSRGE